VKIAGQSVPHESARGHVTGEALYTDDLVGRFPQLLHAWPVMAPHAHALVTRLDASGAMAEAGVVATLTRDDVPGQEHPGEPLFPSEVMFHRQAVAWVLGESLEAAQRGAARVTVEYQALPAILTIEEAIAAGKQGFLTVEGIVPMQGGLPVIVEDKVIGAVGVSGVTSDQDEQIALAALGGLSV